MSPRTRAEARSQERLELLWLSHLFSLSPPHLPHDAAAPIFTLVFGLVLYCASIEASENIYETSGGSASIRETELALGPSLIEVSAIAERGPAGKAQQILRADFQSCSQPSVRKRKHCWEVAGAWSGRGGGVRGPQSKR